MAFRLRSARGIAALVGATLAIGGGAAAIGVAAGGGFGREEAQQDFADALSERVGTEVTIEDIEAARLEAAKATLERAVQEGRLTQDEADRMLERIEKGPERREQMRETREALAAPIAEALGVSVEELREARRDGTTLLELARENNVSRADLEAAVKKGIAAAAQVTGRDAPEGAELEEQVERIVESESPPGPRGGPRKPGGPGGFFGGP